MSILCRARTHVVCLSFFVYIVFHGTYPCVVSSSSSSQNCLFCLLVRMLFSLRNPSKKSCFCMCSAAKNKCIFIFLYCPWTQWGQIKKSESNDGKANSELFETGAWEGMVADNSAKKRETNARALVDPHISNMLQHDQKLLLRIHVPQHVGVSKYMPNKI